MKRIALAVLVLCLISSVFPAHAAVCTTSTRTGPCSSLSCTRDVCVDARQRGVNVGITAPLISYAEQRTLTAAWPQTGSLRASTTKAPTPTSVPTDTSSGAHYTPENITTQEQALADLVNEDRAKQGLPALPLDDTLSAIARVKSQDMRDNRYFAHQSPTLGYASDMLKTANYSFVSVSENIARSGSIAKAHAALLSSKEHRIAIMGSQWTRMGIGIALDKNQYPYVTQFFVR